MARGQQKIQSQQKNAKKAAEKKKSQGADQKTAAKAALVHTCPVCRLNIRVENKPLTCLCRLHVMKTPEQPRCPTPRRSSSTLRANTPSPRCPRSWQTSRHKGTSHWTGPEPEPG
ncbi:hypothetical protein INR49_008110 [Caranx melampygus]|nr:hypothetical protein INR49_008110 [Caranx melampygus]